MSMPGTHLAVGMSCGFVLSVAVPWLRRRWPRVGPLFMLACGAWALIPDGPRLVRALPWFPLKRLFGSEALSTALLWIGDVFCFHRWLDAHDPSRAYLIGWAAAMLMVLAVFVYYAVAWPRGPTTAGARRMDDDG